MNFVKKYKNKFKFFSSTVVKIAAILIFLSTIGGPIFLWPNVFKSTFGSHVPQTIPSKIKNPAFVKISPSPKIKLLPTQMEITPQPYDTTQTIQEGSSYTDNQSDLTIGVNTVYPTNTSDVTISYTGKENEPDNVVNGEVIPYPNNGVTYLLIIKEVHFNMDAPNNLVIEIKSKD